MSGVPALAICRCATHGIYGVGIINANGVMRSIPLRCCTEWRIVRSIPFTAQLWRTLGTIAYEAALQGEQIAPQVVRRPGFSISPWYDDGYRIYAATDDTDKRNGRMIIEYKHVPDFNEADAALLTASPQLFAAVIEAVNIIRTWHGEAGWPIYLAEAPEMQRLMAALQAATGTLARI